MFTFMAVSINATKNIICLLYGTPNTLILPIFLPLIVSFEKYFVIFQELKPSILIEWQMVSLSQPLVTGSFTYWSANIHECTGQLFIYAFYKA